MNGFVGDHHRATTDGTYNTTTTRTIAAPVPSTVATEEKTAF